MRVGERAGGEADRDMVMVADASILTLIQAPGMPSRATGRQRSTEASWAPPLAYQSGPKKVARLRAAAWISTVGWR